MKKKRENKNPTKVHNTFDCPSCGNPLFLSNRDIIRCEYCKTAIVPQGFGALKNREAVIFEKRNGGD